METSSVTSYHVASAAPDKNNSCYDRTEMVGYVQWLENIPARYLYEDAT